MTEIPQVTPPITPPNRVNASATYDQETHDFRMSEIQMAEELVLAIAALNVVSEEVEDAAAAALDDAIEASDAADAVSDLKAAIDIIKAAIDMQEAAVVASTGLDLTGFSFGDHFQVIDDGLGEKILAISPQRRERKAAFEAGGTPTLDCAAATGHHGTLTANTTVTLDFQGFGSISDNEFFNKVVVSQGATAYSLDFEVIDVDGVAGVVEWDGTAGEPDPPAANSKAMYVVTSDDGHTVQIFQTAKSFT